MSPQTTSPRWVGPCYECRRERELETRYDHAAKALCDACASRPPRRLSEVGLTGAPAGNRNAAKNNVSVTDGNASPPSERKAETSRKPEVVTGRNDPPAEPKNRHSPDIPSVSSPDARPATGAERKAAHEARKLANDRAQSTSNGRRATAHTAKVYEITWSDHKPPRLVLPDVPGVDDTAGLCAWLTCTFNINTAHPITTGRHEGLRGPDGHAVLERRGAPPLRFEPQSKINTPARLIEVLSWQTLPTDGAVHALKGEHCRQIAHVVRMLCGATKAITDEEETAALVLVFLAEAIAQEGFTLYGTTEQRYEAATALQRELDEHTGRPRGIARYLIDANTGEYVIRAQDLGESVRRQLGSGLARGFIDGRMAGIGWTKAALDGHALAGRAGRTGPHARCNVYRGLLAIADDDGSVTT